MDKISKNKIKDIIEDIIKIRDKQFLNYIRTVQDFCNGGLTDTIDDDWVDPQLLLDEYGITHEDIEYVRSLSIPSDEELEKMYLDNIELEKINHDDIWAKYEFEFDAPLIKLNQLLDSEEQHFDVLKIQKLKYKEVFDIEYQMKKIQAKKYITVKEFAEIYNISKTSQQNYRGRLNDALPVVQLGKGYKIQYEVSEVEKWLERNGKL